ncbi:hypothetical protein [uncultured Sulfitobacter sp.]|uniref:hypothetical protein n=1 Tax=uncultured Sulfitobacter sp. TaxID=191468 RepID=UPI002595AB82|nr:hypothetical protein [uncultured Sulfitobacter sp.]
MKIEFVPKVFTSAHNTVIGRANALIDYYNDLGLKLTLRQIYYQFVAEAWIPNNLNQYKRLSDILNDARLAGRVDWNAIIDRTRFLRGQTYWDDPEEAVDNLAERYMRDPWNEGQEYYFELWEEKDALIGVVQPTCDRLRINYFSCRGYVSASAIYQASRRIGRKIREGYKVVILHMGDHDPSGVQMSQDNIDRLAMLMGTTDFDFKRIALNMKQIEKYKPPPNYAKIGDTRKRAYVERFNTEECWELDALKPDVIDEIIAKHVEPHILQEPWDETMQRETEERELFEEIRDNWELVKLRPWEWPEPKDEEEDNEK